MTDLDPFLFRCAENGCGRVFASSRGLASHRGRVHNDRPTRTCPACGCIVGDKALHEQYHENQQRIATMAHHADVMTRPLGGVQ